MTDFSDSGSRVQERLVSVVETEQVEEKDLDTVFELQRCEDWVREHGYTRVSLQFPDYLITSAPAVAKGLGERLEREVFILGDTSYGECCVDEVAAEHLNADCVIHFGHTCLTPSQKIPVLYVFTIKSLNVEDFSNSIRSTITDETSSLVIIYDVEYHHALHNFTLSDWKGNLVVGVPTNTTSQIEDGFIRKFGRKFKVSSLEELTSSKNVIYVSSPASDNNKINNFVFSFATSDFYLYNNSSGLQPASRSIQKQLMKRYFLIEKTKDAERIGILVGTLGVANFNDVIERLRTVIKKSGKKCYTFLVGKLNPQKLANFPEIEVFVLVACPETSFPDNSEFFQSVITPYELEIALLPNREWGGQYLSDFRDLLQNGTDVDSTENKDDICGDDSSCSLPPDVSLVTGRVRTAVSQRGEGEEGGGELMVVNDRTVSELHVGGGGQFLATRSWSGLERKLGETPVEGLVQGRPGLAAQYQGEGES